MKRRLISLTAGASVLAVGVGAALIAGPLTHPSAADATPPTVATTSIERKTLDATTQVDGTLGYADSYTVANALSTGGPGADAAAAEQAYAQAKAQLDQAASALTALKLPAAADVRPLEAQLAQAEASVSQASAALANDRAALTTAKSALAACEDAPSPSPSVNGPTPAPCDVSALEGAVQQAQGRVSIDEAQLAGARAQREAAQTALSAREHPTAAQLLQANDAVAAAQAALAAAKARLDQPRGVLTGVAAVGTVVSRGDTLYTLDGTVPVVLMIGDVPAWRTLQAGVADGVDIRELETNLEALGFAPAALTVDTHWDAQTTAAVKAWQKALGVSQTGVIDLGSVVFEPTPLRVTAQSASLGSTVQPGTPIVAGSSTSRVVSIQLDPELQSKVKVGDPVSVVLPDGSTAGGSISDVGTVATVPASAGNGQGGNAAPTITVVVTLDDPAATGTLDQAPVQVNITTQTAQNVLAVPVSALVRLLEGGYAVQVDDHGTLRYVGVQLGLFADGWVEIRASGLTAGEKVVVAK